MVGVAGLGALLNPFGLIDSILSLLGLDFYRDKTGEGPDKTRTTKQPPGSKRTGTKQPTGSGRYRRTTLEVTREAPLVQIIEIMLIGLLVPIDLLQIVEVSDYKEKIQDYLQRLLIRQVMVLPLILA